MLFFFNLNMANTFKLKNTQNQLTSQPENMVFLTHDLWDPGTTGRSFSEQYIDLYIDEACHCNLYYFTPNFDTEYDVVH